jgi:glyoxylase-like metal-dependent hydrolase (beta-lactamase superfamily II)
MHEKDSQFPPTGKTPSRDTTRISGKIMKLLPESGYEPFNVTRKLQDGEIIDTAGGLKVIHTPGHTDGHISLLHLESETLITGDSIFNMTSRMTWALRVLLRLFRVLPRLFDCRVIKGKLPSRQYKSSTQAAIIFQVVDSWSRILFHLVRC